MDLQFIIYLQIYESQSAYLQYKETTLAFSKVWWTYHHRKVKQYFGWRQALQYIWKLRNYFGHPRTVQRKIWMNLELYRLQGHLPPRLMSTSNYWIILIYQICILEKQIFPLLKTCIPVCMQLYTRSDNKVRELITTCLPWQQWTETSVWFDDVGISAFHTYVVVVDL
jgi:hypothetical protein